MNKTKNAHDVFEGNGNQKVTDQKTELGRVIKGHV